MGEQSFHNYIRIKNLAKDYRTRKDAMNSYKRNITEMSITQSELFASHFEVTVRADSFGYN